MNRNMQIFAGIAAAAAVALVIWLFAFGGGEQESDEPREAAVETEEPAAPEPQDQQAAEPAETQEAAVPEAAEEQAAEQAAEEPAAEEPAAEGAASNLVAPSFDVVRVEPNGDVVIAGRAMPGASVTVLDNNKSLGEVEADGRGEWVFLPDDRLPPGTHELSLEAEKDGVTLLSENVAIVVVPEPQVAAAEPAEPAEPAQPGSGAGGEASAPEAGVEASVQEPLAVLTSRDGEGGGTQILQSPGEGTAPEALVLEAVDYDAEGNIAVSGKGAPGNSIIVYLDNAPMGQTTIGENGRWTVEGDKPVGYGLFTLRADQLGPDGAVISRVETPFSRIEIELADLPQDQFVVVEPGNSLWVIARRLLGSGLNYSVIFEANSDQIRDPNLIYPGQIFLVPQTPDSSG